MDIFFDELIGSFPDARQWIRLFIRLGAATFLGAIVGLERERCGKSAGVRTHMLVTLGSALFVLGPAEFGMNSDELSRVIQGIVTGIGFVGGGAILKLHKSREIEGLTTAAGILMTAAIGVSAGLGRIGLALVSTVLAWVILSMVANLEHRLGERKGTNPKNGPKKTETEIC